MPSRIRTPSPLRFLPPTNKKRRISFDDESMFTCPVLPENCVNDDNGELLPVGSVLGLRDIILVPTTDSLEWGDATIAAQRALIEPNMTTANKELFRTYHPPLGNFGDVYLAKEGEDRWMWVLAPEVNEVKRISTHAGGLEIHLKPHGFIEMATKFPSRHHLHKIREMFPSSIGARVLISGFIVILFKSRGDIEKSWSHDGMADTFGNLRLQYDILQEVPTKIVVPKGAAITANPDSFDTHAAIGLKLRFPDGQEAVTVPTHAFVRLRGPNPGELDRPAPSRIADLYEMIKRKLARFSPMKRGISLPAIGFGRSLGNSPIGKRVYLAGGKDKIGRITYTFDPLTPKPLRFPIGFVHDLSLVQEFVKPIDLICPEGTPTVVGWGRYTDFLAGKRAFVTRYNITTGNLITRAGRGIAREAQIAIAEGTQYIWDRELVSENVSVLWRTEWETESLGGFSGSAVCLGEMQDRTCVAICFQNFETGLSSVELLKADHQKPPTSVAGLRIKGGFLLPPEILNTEILCSPSAELRVLGTYPSRSRQSGDLRRSFSSTN